jgi:excisionase family DNA binding protein
VSSAPLTTRDVAERLGVCPETVLRWERQGELPAIRLPGTARGRLRFREADLEAWLAVREVGRGAPGGVSQPGGRARNGGYVPLLSPVSANPPPEGGDNPGGS